MRKRILVVERDEDIIRIIGYILEEEGYLVSLSRTEEGILDWVIKEQPDAILLDIIKPTVEGTALCNAIKSVKSIKHIPVIVLSTYSQIKSVNIECADDIINKPFDISELINVIEDHLVI